jgi:hypothetical protein
MEMLSFYAGSAFWFWIEQVFAMPECAAQLELESLFRRAVLQRCRTHGAMKRNEPPPTAAGRGRP